MSSAASKRTVAGSCVTTVAIAKRTSSIDRVTSACQTVHEVFDAEFVRLGDTSIANHRKPTLGVFPAFPQIVLEVGNDEHTPGRIVLQEIPDEYRLPLISAAIQ